MPERPRARRRLAALACGAVGLLALGADRPAGLLFHASFDRRPEAEISVGRADPYIFLQPDARRRDASFRTLPGAFGGAITAVMGSFDALGNVLPERGTIAFFARLVGPDLGEYPLKIGTLDSYYWRTHVVIARLGAVLAGWVADESFAVDPSTRGPSGSLLVADRWRHLAIAWDQAYGLNFYIDGERVASSWGRRSWLGRGVDPAEIGLAWAGGKVAYDELYSFDRALSDAQIRALARTNRVPRADELPRLEFDARRRANRLRELGWEGEDATAKLELDANGNGSLTIRPVAPLDARALLAEAGAVFDGKLGQGWPSRWLLEYEYADGGGLSVELAEAFDTLLLEGSFAGRLYAGRHLREPSAKPLHVFDGERFRSRWRPQTAQAGWLSFFPSDPAKRKTRPIAELSFLRTERISPPASAGSTAYLDRARRDPVPRDFAVEIDGRFGEGDRRRFAVAADPPPSGSVQLEALRFAHVVLPPREREWAFRALKLDLSLQGELDGTPLQVELRDPLQPGRRIAAIDFSLHAGPRTRSGQIELRIDVGPRIVAARRPLWLALVAGRDLDLLLGSSSRITTVELPVADAASAFAARELPYLRTLFRPVSEQRPWVWYEHPERELAPFNPLARQLLAPLTLLHAHSPENERVAALWAWTHKQTPHEIDVEPLALPTHPNAPRWALLQRELRDRARAVLDWWIANRQAPSGEFGDGWNDDTDLIQNHAGLALLGDAGRLRDSAKAVADGVYASGRIRDGLNSTPLDPLHAYEEGMNAQQVMALLDPGNPVYLERLMDSARAVEERLMTTYAPGRRAFRSAQFGTDRVDLGPWSYDSLQHAIMLAPALTVAYYNRNPRAIRTVREWLEGWLDEYSKPRLKQPGPPFASRRDTGGKILERSWMPRGWGLVSLFPALDALTRDPRYRASMGYWTGEGSGTRFLEDSPELHLLVDLLDAGSYRDQLLRWSRAAALDRVGDDYGELAMRRFVESQLTGAVAPAEQALAGCVGKLRREFPAYTWAEPIDDRIWLPVAPLLAMAQGGLSHQRNQLWPQHYVSYAGFTDLAAWVREKSASHLRIWLYSFAPEQERGSLRLWRSAAGRYRLRLGPDADLDGLPDSSSQSEELRLKRLESIPIAVPSGRLLALELTLDGVAEAEAALPDLALSSAQRVGDRLEVTLHNLGSAPARDVVVEVTDGAGTRVGLRKLPLLEAPTDLVPRRQALIFEPLALRGPVQIEADPQARIAELNEENNALQIAADR